MKVLFPQELLSQWNVIDYGVTSEAVPISLAHYNDWVFKKKNLPLLYLEGERQTKRQDLKNYWPDFQSAIVFLFSYHDSHQLLKRVYAEGKEWNGLKIASYTMGFEGEDYHHLLKEKLYEIGEYLKNQDGSLEYKLTLDTHPILERDLAFRAGLGWFGKNSMMINRHHGSFFIIGSLLLNKSIDSKSSLHETDHCGQCTLCVEACPTKAIDPQTRTITAVDCISTFTIEQFKIDSVPSDKMDLKSGWIFGCDICQDVCPWNKRVDRKNVTMVSLNEDQEKIVNFLLRQNKTDLLNQLEVMSEGEFRRQLKGTSFERSGRRGLLKNLRLLLKQLDIFS